MFWNLQFSPRTWESLCWMISTMEGPRGPKAWCGGQRNVCELERAGSAEECLHHSFIVSLLGRV